MAPLAGPFRQPPGLRPRSMPRALALASLVLALAACAGRPPEPAPADALVDVWAAIPAGNAQLGGLDVPAVCDEPFGTWFADFGVRGLACSADRKLPLAGVVARGPGPVWTSGPHRPTAGSLGLDLTAPRAFGHYDPAFVRWAVANGVPRSRAARTLAQPVYQAHVRRLARVYWATYRTLAAEGFPEAPRGAAATYAAFLDGGPDPPIPTVEVDGVSMFSLFDDASQPIARQMSRELAPRGATMDDWNEWEVRYEANTAFGFWVRRRADGTLPLFRDGLRDVLAAFDADWLEAHPLAG